MTKREIVIAASLAPLSVMALVAATLELSGHYLLHIPGWLHVLYYGLLAIFLGASWRLDTLLMRPVYWLYEKWLAAVLRDIEP